MKNKTTLAIAIIAFAALIVAAALLYNEFSDDFKPDTLATAPSVTTANSPSADDADTPSKTTASQADPNPAPDFTVLDWEGNSVKLSDFFGKPIVLNFWASWCGPCKSEMPDFNEMYAERGDEITFMMVNLTDKSRETVDVAKAFIENQGYTFPVYFDTEYSAASVYNTYSIPVTYFIDKDGNLITYAMGALDAATLEKGIGMITE